MSLNMQRKEKNKENV